MEFSVVYRHRFFYLLVTGLVGAALYVFYWPHFPVGIFNDDASYILAAKSLWQGRYVMLSSPHQDPLIWYLPGYPLFLSPWVKLVEPHWSWLKLTSVVLTLGSGLLTWIWLDFCPRLWRRAGLALLLWNPFVAISSVTLMPEALFLFILLAVFLTLKELVSHESPGLRWGLAGMLGWISCVRPEGILVAVSVAIGLGYGKHWRSLLAAIGLTLSIWGSIVARNYRLYSHYSFGSNNFLRQFQSERLSVIYFRLLVQTYRIFQTLFGNLFIGTFSSTESLAGKVAGGAMTLLILYFVVQGYRTLSKSGQLSKSVLAALGVFFLLMGLIHILWMQVEMRYFVPLLPFVIGFGMAGLRSDRRTWGPSWKFAVAILGAAITLGYGMQYGHQNLQAVLPIETFEWVQHHTPSDSVILTPDGATVYLYTHRPCVGLPPMEDLEEFRYWAQKRSVNYFLAHSREIILPERQQMWTRTSQWAALNTSSFHEIYRNANESETIYALTADPTYITAFENFLSASMAFDEGAWKKGLPAIQHALQLEPHMIRALNARTMALFALDSNSVAAQQSLRETLKLNPEHPLTLLNLARLCRYQKQEQSAQNYYLKSLQAIQTTGDFKDLQPVIEQERKL